MSHVTNIEQIDPATVVDFYDRINIDPSELGSHICYTFTLDTDPGQSYALIDQEAGYIAVVTNAEPGWWELRSIPKSLSAVRATIKTALFTDDLELIY